MTEMPIGERVAALEAEMNGVQTWAQNLSDGVEKIRGDLNQHIEAEGRAMNRILLAVALTLFTTLVGVGLAALRLQ